MLPLFIVLNALLCHHHAVLAEIISMTEEEHFPGKNITDVVKVHNTTFPGKLQIIEELTIQVNVTEFGHPNKTEVCRSNKKQSNNQETNGKSLNCCLMIYPPTCDTKSCTFQRKKVCWNVCSYEIEILGKEQFSKLKYLKEVVPDNWRQGNFDENVTVNLLDEYKSPRAQAPQQYPPYPYLYPYLPYMAKQYSDGSSRVPQPVA